jgi:RNA 2',3'-cyclic 3'-phosphodiesterase
MFVALEPPARVREELIVWARGATAGWDRSGSLRLLGPDALHLTVCFLGDRPLEEIKEIGEVLSECAMDVGELSIGAPLWLPPRRPRALAVEVKDQEGGLQALHEAVVGALAQVSEEEANTATGARAGHCHLGSARDRRSGAHRFRPHVTLARLRGGFAPRERRLDATPALSFTPAALVLYRSRLAPAGASYEALESSALQPLG